MEKIVRNLKQNSTKSTQRNHGIIPINQRVDDIPLDLIITHHPAPKNLLDSNEALMGVDTIIPQDSNRIGL